MPAIDFEDQTGLETDEVDDELPEYVLAAKFVAVETTAAQARPEDSFGCRLFRPQVASVFVKSLMASHISVLTQT